jgi:pimeloyl-ACP methyl ester carboxylesterase
MSNGDAGARVARFSPPLVARYPRVIASANGVTLRERGAGRPVFVFPGMEGSGESCLELIEPLCAGPAFGRVVLVDYAREEHATFDALVETIRALVIAAAQDEPAIIWGQSFGNLLAATVPAGTPLAVRAYVFVSPFTRLPRLKARLGAFGLALMPALLYRATIKPTGRLLFGPPGDAPDHPFFATMRAARPRDMARRASWLTSTSYAAAFESVTPPAKAWFGERDRLVDRAEQWSFFERLASIYPGFDVATIPGSGHVVLPSVAVRRAQSDIAAWLSSLPSG